MAVLATDGVEQVELERPWQALEEAGAEPVLVSLDKGTITAYQHIDKGDTKKVEAVVSTADPDDYAALVLPGGVINGDFVRADADAADYDGLVQPGGVANPDFLRGDPDAVAFFRGFFEAKKPVGVICHGPWMLVEAGVAKGRTVTSWPSVKTDLRNAGANWVDEEVVVDEGLVTSRKPDDLPAFCAKMIEEFVEGRHAEQAQKTRTTA